MTKLNLTTKPLAFAKVLLTLVIFCGCEDEPIKQEKFVNRQECVGTIYINDKQNVPIYTYVIDSCEYVGLITNFHNQFLTHKGNCKFCAERSKKIIATNVKCMKYRRIGTTALSTYTKLIESIKV